MRPVYRLRQFWQNVTAAPLPGDAWNEIESVLSPAEVALFRRLAASDRRHSYGVMQTLRSADHTHPALLAAALLHDVGKTRVPLTVWDRTLIVAAETAVPRRSAAWGQGTPHGWKRPFVVKAQHAAWGAEMAAAAGSRSLTVALIRRHQDPLPEAVEHEEDRLLHWLQWADEQN